ncbi:MAG: cytochrome c biogenesis protein CcsA [Rhodospirillales bacterium]|nr:cytochrome c biogenesis protein CcsA [Rhodospirillales bacterium]
MPVAVLLICLVYLAMQLRPQSMDSPYDVASFAAIPATADGRVKPLDTIARNAMVIISGKQFYDHENETYPAIQWLLDLWGQPEKAATYNIFRIDHPEVFGLIDIEPEGRKRFNYAELREDRAALEREALRAFEIEEADRSAYEAAVLKLFSNMRLYERLMLLERPHLVPPMTEDAEWQPFIIALAHEQQFGATNEAADELKKVLRSYIMQSPGDFNVAVNDYESLTTDLMPNEVRRSRIEVFFNHVEPFYHGTALYVLGFMLSALAFLLQGFGGRGWAKAFVWSALLVLLLTFVLHTAGLGTRMYLQRRPPVTNLYSAAVFIGWVAVLAALGIEWLFRNGLGSLIASVIGCLTLIIAHNLAGDGDTMQMMQAVLDTNFWLSTHVITITIGYSAMFLAGFIGIVMVFIAVITGVTRLARDMSKAGPADDDAKYPNDDWLIEFDAQFDRKLLQTLGKMIYGTIAFALLFSFIGTVLGGIWADQSWGRFWGWDPKENGAVLIVLMTALALHARWGGMIRERGMALLAIAGNIVTAWSWFGTNMLGVGLHAYGFIDSAVFWLLLFWASQIVLIGIGLLPLPFWSVASRPRSTRPDPDTIPPSHDSTAPNVLSA